MASPPAFFAETFQSGHGLLLLLSLLLSVAWILLGPLRFWKKGAKGSAPLPPGPRGLPLVGVLPFLDPNLPRYFACLGPVHGPIVSVRLGSTLCVVANSAAIAKEILKDHDAAFGNHVETGRLLAIRRGGRGVGWSPYSVHQQKHRKYAVAEFLSSAKLDSFRDRRRHAIRRAVRHVHANVGSPVDIGELMFDAMTDVVTAIFWGGTLPEKERRRVAAELRPLTEDVLEVFGRFDVFEFFPALSRFDFLGVVRRTGEVAERLHALLDSMIDRRVAINRSGEVGDKDLLQLLVQIMEENSDQKVPLTRADIRSIFIDLQMAGVDTTMQATQWAMAELLHNSEIRRKVEEELEQVVGKQSMVEESHLPNLRYLNAVVKETLRLHPATPLMLPRTPKEPRNVGGYAVPMGSLVLVNMWAIHRDPETWENPTEFRPERFLAANWDYGGSEVRYFPFGSGRRICMGLALADRMLMYMLASLLHSFSWRLPEGTAEVDFSEKVAITVRKAAPLLAVPRLKLPSPDLYL